MPSRTARSVRDAGPARPDRLAGLARRGPSAPAAWLLAIGVAASIGAPAGAATPGELGEELARQQALLERIERGEAGALPEDPTLRADARPVDPREAAPAPPLRELPRTIFDEAPVTIPARQWGNPRPLRLVRLELDADGDQRPELVRYVDPRSQLLVRQDEDRDYDGVLDAFSEFEWGELVRRALDEDGDGRIDAWERYEDGRLRSRELDRDGDGVRDAFFEYDGRWLALERHDTNGDGTVDREVRYRDGRRTSATEDLDGDGRTDVWYRYAVQDGRETVERIERDVSGRGRPDVFETFEPQGGRAVLARHEEDTDGDGRIDLVDVYRSGRLVRRELARPGLRPLRTQPPDRTPDAAPGR